MNDEQQQPDALDVEEAKAGLLDDIDYCLQAADALDHQLRSLRASSNEMPIDDIRKDMADILSECETALNHTFGTL